MPKASRKELRKALFKRGADARGDHKKEAKSKFEAIEATKPVKEPAAKRYILFVGNLPYDVTEEEIKDHFRNCKIASLRLRQNGICFLEFGGEDAASQLHHALSFHHTIMRKRKINVEFSAGGGGNSAKRREKIAKKNKDFQAEKQKAPESSHATRREPAPKSLPAVDPTEAAASGINPARLAALRSKSK